MTDVNFPYRAATAQELELLAAPETLNSIKELSDAITSINESFATAVRWSPAFKATGLTFTGSGTSYPTYNSHYVKYGKMVTFFIEIDMATVTNFGTGQLIAELPFMPLSGTMNHFHAWALVSPSVNPDFAGHVVLQADHLANTKDLDLHWYSAATATPKPVMENMLTGSSPLTLTNEVKIYVNGTYISS